eukprot:scaffold17086_cov93-Cylindrotheca_fusiformis.AAC.1
MMQVQKQPTLPGPLVPPIWRTVKEIVESLFSSQVRDDDERRMTTRTEYTIADVVDVGVSFDGDLRSID